MEVIRDSQQTGCEQNRRCDISPLRQDPIGLPLPEKDQGIHKSLEEMENTEGAVQESTAERLDIQDDRGHTGPMVDLLFNRS
jgi:hypothetical protein